MAEHKSTSRPGDVQIYARLMGQGVPANRLRQLAARGMTAKRIEELHDGNGNIAEPANTEDENK